jgi:hypothetical protein
MGTFWWEEKAHNALKIARVMPRDVSRVRLMVERLKTQVIGAITCDDAKRVIHLRRCH